MSNPKHKAQREDWRPGRFVLSSEDCDLLMALDAAGSTEGAARLLAKHASVVSRQLARLADRAAVIEKPHGRWRLTKVGASVVQWAREQAAAQERILFAPSRVRIATTREFGARVVAPALAELRLLFGVACVEIIVLDVGVQQEVLDGRADVGLTCGRASDPAVAFRSLVDEPYVVVAPASWPKRTFAGTIDQPHIAYSRAPTTTLLALEKELAQVIAVFNDIAAVREACVEGAGWCVLPRYTVAREIASRQLRVLDAPAIAPDRFGMFWLRSRTRSLPWLDALGKWLAAQRL